jgi:hypothetical protein
MKRLRFVANDLKGSPAATTRNPALIAAWDEGDSVVLTHVIGPLLD